MKKNKRFLNIVIDALDDISNKSRPQIVITDKETKMRYALSFITKRKNLVRVEGEKTRI